MRTNIPPVTAALAILACSPGAKNAIPDTAVASATPAGASSPAATLATKPSTDPSFHPAWSKNSVNYEVNIRQYTPEGTLAAFRSHIPRLKALGADILWLRFFEKDTIDWRGPPLADFHRTVFELKHTQPALANGPWGGAQTALQTTGGRSVYAYTRTQGMNTVVVAVNFDNQPANVMYRGLTRTGAYRDWFAKTPVTLGDSGRIVIPANGFRVFVR